MFFHVFKMFAGIRCHSEKRGCVIGRFAFSLFIPRLLVSLFGDRDVPRGSCWGRVLCRAGGGIYPHHENWQKISVLLNKPLAKSHFARGGKGPVGSVRAQTFLLARQACASPLIRRKLLPL